MMDWSKIELEVQSRTASIMKNRSRSELGNFNSSLPLDHSTNMLGLGDVDRNLQGISYSHYMQSSDKDPSELSLLSREISELKSLVMSHAQKMTAMERVIRNFDEVLESNTNVQLEVTDRLNQYEHDLHSISKFATSANRERADFNVHSKTMNLRLQRLEDTGRHFEETFSWFVCFFNNRETK
jgi:hypothetical protein